MGNSTYRTHPSILNAIINRVEFAARLHLKFPCHFDPTQPRDAIIARPLKHHHQTFLPTPTGTPTSQL